MPMKKFIFLDFDGVMATPRYSSQLHMEGKQQTDRYGAVFDPKCIDNLRSIVEATGADIVVSSSWKDVLHYEGILQMWKDRNMPGFLTDVTSTRRTRGEEIKAWLDMYSKTSGEDDLRYVILDVLDEDNFLEEQAEQLVIVDAQYGLSDADAVRAIDILNDDISDDDFTFNKEEFIKETKHFLKVAMKIIIVLISLFVVFLLVKVASARVSTRHVGDFADEKQDILERSEYLRGKLLVSPDKLISEMPSAVGEQFQGEWALYSCSMYTAALVNISKLYPETKEEAINTIDSLIRIVMSPELRKYDNDRWGEDPLGTLDGDGSHISYLSHLAWMIGGYKSIGGDGKYNDIHRQICETMNRRMLQSTTYNLPTYPGEYIYIPDMLVAVVALSEYSRLNNGEYWSTVYNWIDIMENELLDEATGLIPSYITDNIEHNRLPVKGSYSALNCYYLSLVDKDFAREQYERVSKFFIQRKPIAGLKEYHDRRCILGFDIDAGPILMNLSPSGTAFMLGPVTFFGDLEMRKDILRTAELAGTTVKRKGKRHYLLANVALVGEAITLAMRTHTDNSNNNE